MTILPHHTHGPPPSSSPPPPRHEKQVEQFNRALAARLQNSRNDDTTTSDDTHGGSIKQQRQLQHVVEGVWPPYILVLIKAALPVLLVNVAGAGAMGHMERWTALDR
jgi:hypothetical protein